VKADISDRDMIAAILKAHRPRAVLNFEAESHVDSSTLESEYFIQMLLPPIVKKS